MIVSLAQDRIREAAKAAAREQAFTDRRGVRGLPMRLDGFPYTEGENTDLTVVFDAVDRADCLAWIADEVTLMVRGDYLRHVRITRGDDVQADVVSSGELDLLLQLAGQMEATAAGEPAGEVLGEVPGWAVTCPPPACGLSGDRLSRSEAEHLAGVHDGLHHGGTPTAAAAPAPRGLGGDAEHPIITLVIDETQAVNRAPSPSGEDSARVLEVLERGRAVAIPVPGGRAAQLLSAPRPRAGAGLAWEVDDPDGVAVYRGADLELACEIYHLAPAGSHLLPVPPAPVSPAQVCPAQVPSAQAAAGPVAAGGRLLGLGAAVLVWACVAAGSAWLAWPHADAAAPRTERVCYSNGVAADVTTSPDGSLTASGEYSCDYRGGA